MPLVYALMSSKSWECYERLFQDLIDFSDEQDIHLQPQFILTDFEQAAINAANTKFPSTQNKGCLFHLAQSVYRKIQTSGLAVRYGTDENFSLLIRQIPDLAGFVLVDPDNEGENRGRHPTKASSIKAISRYNMSDLL